MPALVAGIHVFSAAKAKDVDGRDKPGHDDKGCLAASLISASGFYITTGRFLKALKIGSCGHLKDRTMTRHDCELLDKQFHWLDRSRSNGLLVFSVASIIIVCMLIGSAGIA